MNPLHHQIKELLLPICLQATREARGGDTKKELPKLPPEFEQLRQHITGWSVEYANTIASMIAVATGHQITWSTKTVDLPLFSVVKCEGNTEGHDYTLNKTYICIHGRDRRFLHETVGFGNKMGKNAIPVKTDEEVEHCLDSLNEHQLRTILRSDLFAPILAPMFAPPEEVELVPIEPTK